MSISLFYVVFVATNLASGFIGWLIGRTARNTAKVAAEVEAVTDDPDIPDETKKRLRDRLRRVRPIHLAVMVLLAVGLITTLTGFAASTRAGEALDTVQRNNECLRQYSNDLADALDARTHSGMEAQEQLDRVFETVAAAFGKPDAQAGLQVRDSIDTYVKLRRTAKSIQSRNPYPEAPRDVCAE